MTLLSHPHVEQWMERHAQASTEAERQALLTAILSALQAGEEGDDVREAAGKACAAACSTTPWDAIPAETREAWCKEVAPAVAVAQAPLRIRCEALRQEIATLRARNEELEKAVKEAHDIGLRRGLREVGQEAP